MNAPKTYTCPYCGGKISYPPRKVRPLDHVEPIHLATCPDALRRRP